MSNPNDNHRKRTSTECTICGAPALHSYVGAIVCPSCKMFFKRNANKEKGSLKCHYDGHCEINIYNRHICSYCRLEKCRQSGMQANLFRPSILNRRSKNIVPIEQIPTINLLHADRSSLTVEQWNTISNIIHCYDEYSQLSTAERYVSEQNRLPVKLRYKTGTVQEILMLLTTSTQTLFEKNADFLTLTPNNRSMLLQKTAKQVSGLAGSFILYASKLLDDQTFCLTTESMFGPVMTLCGRVASLHLDPDPVFVKLIVATLMFSTFDCEDSTSGSPSILPDVRSVLKIQDRYIELIWKYMVYKYDDQRAVRCFSNLIRSLFSINHAVHAAIEIQQYNHMVETLINQTEQTLIN